MAALQLKEEFVRKVLAFVLAATSLTLGACGRGPSDDDIARAYVAAFICAVSAPVAISMGETVPCVSLDEQTGALIFDNCDPGAFLGADALADYTGLSGTVTRWGDDVRVDFTLTGGPVESIAFIMTGDQMTARGGFQTDVTVNGELRVIQVRSDDLTKE